MTTQDETQTTAQQDGVSLESGAASHSAAPTTVLHFFRAGGVWATSAVLFTVFVIVAAITGEWLTR